ncbi:MAG: S8 family serine peptidase [Calditrichaeota bacterium]|nr:S8 family serine peptidase [Calditrichota bacterium]
MKKSWFQIILAACLMFAGQGWTADRPPNAEIIVKFRSVSALPTTATATGRLVQLDAIQQLEREFSPLQRMQRFRQWPQIKSLNNNVWESVELWRLADSVQVRNILEKLRALPEVEYAEVNHVFKIRQHPVNDPDLDRQWYLNRIGALLAWELPGATEEVIVGVIDTGVDYLHEDLREHIWVNVAEDLNRNGRLDSLDLNGVDDDGNGYVDDVIGWDFTHAPLFADYGDYLDPDNDPMDEFYSGHGTSVASLIAAVPDNGVGIAGVAPVARIMILRAGTASGYLQEDDVAEAILYAIDNGCRIVNLSFGDVAYSYLLRDVIRYGSRRGVLFVAAAGNSGNAVPQFPAAFDETISVGATDVDNARASFSSYGTKLDLVAPGQGLWACQIGNRYGSVSGTSFAAPLVSGALALLWSHFPDASAEDLKNMLFAGCRDLEVAGWDRHTGHGLLNIYHSLQMGAGGWAEIRYPGSYDGVFQDTVAIVGTAAGPEFLGYRVAFGVGTDPDQWYSLREVEGEQIVNDTLAMWGTTGLADSVYTLELRVQQYGLPDRVFRTQVYLDRSPPRILQVNVLPMLIKTGGGYLVELTTDDPTTAVLHLQSDPLSEPFPIKSPYRQTRHYFLLESHHLTDGSRFWLEVVNPAGLVTRSLSDQDAYPVPRLEMPPMQNRFQLEAQYPVEGYLMPFWVDFDRDGQKEVVISRLDEQRNFGPLEIFEFDRQNLLPVEAIDFPAIPRDAGNVGADSLLELIAGYGKISFAFQGTADQAFPNHLVWVDTANFWASRLADLDGDAQPELLAIQKGQWGVYRFQDAGFEPIWQQWLENPSSGDNQYGIPWILPIDLDADSLPELVFGDYDGDVVIQKRAADGDFHPWKWTRLTGADATYLLQDGDVNGDGVPELVVITSVQPGQLTESNRVATYWVVHLLTVPVQGEVEISYSLAIHGVQKSRGQFQGLAVADVDGDDQEEILFAAFPRLFVLGWQDSGLVLEWYRERINTNAILVADVDGDSKTEMLLNADGGLNLFEYQSGMVRPLPPGGVQATPLDTRHVLVQWRAVPEARFYLLYRSMQPDSLILLDTVRATVYLDSTVQSGHTYYYRISAVNPAYPIPESAPSPIVSATPNPPPRVVDVRVLSARQLELTFSEPMSENAFQVQPYREWPQGLQPISVVRGKQGTVGILSFEDPLMAGEHRLALVNLQDASGTPLSLDTTWVSFTIPATSDPFYVLRVTLQNKTRLEVEFNHPVEPVSATDVSNYRLVPDGVIEKAVVDTANHHRVWLLLDRQNRMGALGVTYHLSIQGVRDIYGNALASETQEFLIIQSVQDLDEIFVYPNPYRMSAAENELMFGKVPRGCEIFIYSATGDFVNRLVETDGDGGVAWNLRNANGELVGSGVYLFIAKYKKQVRSGKFLLIR